MTEDYELAPKEIIWAKVDPYPWWPGKIVRKFQQNNATVYKVSFFCDPTYCFLHRSQLVRFADFDRELNSTFPHNLKLQKAEELAQMQFQKRKSCDKTMDEEQPTPVHLEEQRVQMNDELNPPSSNIVENQQKTQLFEFQQTNNESGINDLKGIEVTCENVISLLEGQSHLLRPQSYCYSRRKQAMQLRSKLKQTLLTKYKLHLHTSKTSPEIRKVYHERQVCTVAIQQQTNVQYSNNYVELNKKKIIYKSKTHRIHFSRKNKTHRVEQEDNLKQICIRKLCYHFKMRGMNSVSYKSKSVQIVNQIYELSDKSNLAIKTIFVKLLKSLREQQILNQRWNPIIFRNSPQLSQKQNS